ncbi:MAG: ImmA/IrrE family metallo-endopeptidase [Lachnospiraceae bacterium]|nr:ImmA/IrrE family metallo-endopeptidase [Lachnospiraceae bacterium]MCI9357861.1 ImmA/IrrE family metallo-endopeptidase [Lachnospiraceae bacterium]
MGVGKLWQGMIMDRQMQKMKEICKNIQGENHEKRYVLEDMPSVTKIILGGLGIKKVPVPIVAIMKSLEFQVVSGKMEDEISGIVAIDDALKKEFKSDKVIAINSKDNIGHQRFTMAHELAHYLFDFDVSNSITYYNAYNTKEDESESERRANYFAANLLMPEGIFREKFKQAVVENNLYLTVDNLSSIFQVSHEAVKRRIAELSLQV